MASSAPPFLHLFFLLLVLLLSHISNVAPSIELEKSALLALQKSLHRGNSLRGWDESTSPCGWRGVKCNEANTTVTSLSLPGSSLSGPIPEGVLGNLTSLTYLSLRSNHVTSPLPVDTSLCTALRKLYLQENHFSEPFPTAFLSLTSLSHLVLSGNTFSDGLPPGLSNLAALKTLNLDRNNFSGRLPDLDLKRLSQFNVSFNPFLVGPIPSGLRDKPGNAFLNTSLCGVPILGACPSEDKADDGKKLSGGAIAGIAVAGVVALVAILAVLCLCCRKRRRRRRNAVAGMDPEAPAVYGGAGGGAVMWERRKEGEGTALVFLGPGERFELEDLLRASAEVLGKGTFGTTYKAMLESGSVVAVKRLGDVEIEAGEFGERVEAIGKMRHANLADLKAYHYSKDEKLLVYAYLQMGSLSGLLHGNKGSGRVPLVWSTRLNVALTTARGIEYIHSRGPNICHGNIRSSNILLTQSYDAVISDHALIQLAKPNSNTNNRSTGYCAPEIRDPQIVTRKADVYSFGILLLEMLTGKEPGQALNDDGMDLLNWVLTFPRDEWSSEVFDMELLRFQSAEDQMVELLQLAIDCCLQFPDSRPTMSDVVVQITEIQHEGLEPVEVEVDLVNMSPQPLKNHQ